MPEPSPTTLEMSSTVGDLDVVPVASRLCGRCRQAFPGDPTLHPVARREWWVCAPCGEALLGRTEARS